MPTSTATAKGHLNLSKQGLRSTKEVEEEEEFNFPSKIHGEHKIVTVTMQILNTEELLHLHADLAGRFPYKSRRGKQYFAVFFNIETNYIRIELLERRTSEDVTNAYRAALDFFEQHGIKVQFVHLDGETSNELEKYIDKKKINIQFAPPGNHRALKAERAIQTVKNHVISSLCTADPSYPMLDWDLFKDQMELTLNLLRGSAVNPSISAWQHVHGPFKWTHTPIAPIGTKVVIHERSADRKSWDPHGKDGFYVGPKMKFYRCYNILVVETGTTRTSDTLAWFPIQCTMPGGSAEEIFSAAIQDLKASINNMANTAPGMMHNKPAVNILAESLTQS